MTTGILPADAANFLLNSDVAGLMDVLGGLYDLVLVDLPPLLAVNDVFLIARYATCCCLSTAFTA